MDQMLLNDGVYAYSAAGTGNDKNPMREVHPFADEDGILRDGGCRCHYHQMIYWHGRENPGMILAEMFDLYNRHFFDDLLPAPRIEAVDEMDGCGNLHWEQGDPGASILTVRTATLLGGYEWARDVLLHEMCHLYVRAVLRDEESSSHAAVWVEQADRLGVYVSDAERVKAAERERGAKRF